MEPRKSIDTAAVATMVVLCAVIGTQQVAIKLAAPDMAPVLQIGLRSGLAALVVLALIARAGESRALFSANWRPGVLAGLFFGVEFVLFAQGLRFTSASHMSIFLYTAPIFSALCLHFCFPEERLDRAQWLGIAIAFGGVVLAFTGHAEAQAGNLAWLGDLLGIAAGLAFGATTLVIRASRLSSAPAKVTLWYQLVGGFLLGTAGAWSLGETAINPTAALIANLAYQTLVISTASYIVWFTLLRRYLMSRIGVLSLMTPMFGVGLSVAVLGDRLTPNFIAGAGLIILGLFLMTGRDMVKGWLASRRLPQERAARGL